jgi:hypothetical protein
MLKQPSIDLQKLYTMEQKQGVQKLKTTFLFIW